MTVTLPDRILRLLDGVSSDRAQAIVKVTEAVCGVDRSGPRKVELVEVAPGKSVIVVGPCASLRGVPWLSVAEMSPGRNLLIIPSGTAVESLEVALLDLLDHEDDMSGEERRLLEQLRLQLGTLRRERRITKAEIIFFDSSAGRGQAGEDAPDRPRPPEEEAPPPGKRQR